MACRYTGRYVLHPSGPEDSAELADGTVGGETSKDSECVLRSACNPSLESHPTCMARVAWECGRFGCDGLVGGRLGALASADVAHTFSPSVMHMKETSCKCWANS